jgi:drug/metabolite transporter (DMT)-like permease
MGHHAGRPASGPHSHRLASAAVLAAAALFGASYEPVKRVTADVDLAAWLGLRFGAAAAVLVAVACRRPAPPRPGVAWAGLACGACLAAAYGLSTLALRFTTSTSVGVLTFAAFVLLVPSLEAMYHRRVGRATLAALGLALPGVMLLNDSGWRRLGVAEVLTISSGLAFALHLLALAVFAPRFDPVSLTATQMLVVAAVFLPFGARDHLLQLGTTACWVAIATGITVSAGAYLLQSYGQRVLGPSRTGLLLLAEPLVVLLIGWAAGQPLGAAQLAGAGLLLGAVLITLLSPH